MTQNKHAGHTFYKAPMTWDEAVAKADAHQQADEFMQGE